MSQEIETITAFSKGIERNNKIKLSYLKMSERLSDVNAKEYISNLQKKIQYSNYPTILQINLAKDGILCQQDCSSIEYLVSNIYKKQDSLECELEVDLKNMLESGGIHYYLQKQLTTINTNAFLTHFTLKLTKELFNTQCLGVISTVFESFENIYSFRFESLIKLDSIRFFERISTKITDLTLKLIDPSINIFPQLSSMKILNSLNLQFDECSQDIPEELLKYLNQSQIKRISLCLRFKSDILISKEQFYNSVSNCIKCTSKKGIQLIEYSIDLTQIEDSGLKTDILQELHNPIILLNLKKLSLALQTANSLNVFMISFLQKLKNLLSSLKCLDTLHLKMSIPIKFVDILKEGLTEIIWKLKEFSLTNTHPTMMQLNIQVQNEDLSNLMKIHGVRVNNNLIKLKYLTKYVVSEDNQDEKLIEQIYLSHKRKLLYSIFAIQNSQLFKRQEIKHDLLKLYFI